MRTEVEQAQRTTLVQRLLVALVDCVGHYPRTVLTLTALLLGVSI